MGEFEKERKEHPKFSESTIRQIVKDHKATEQGGHPFIGCENSRELQVPKHPKILEL